MWCLKLTSWSFLTFAFLRATVQTFVDGYNPTNTNASRRRSPSLVDDAETPSTSSRKGLSRQQLLRGGCSRMLGLALIDATSQRTLALAPEEASRAYNQYASNYDDLDGGKASTLLGIDQARSELFSKASGNVLEIGAGTGLNLAKYDPSKLTSLTLLDVSQGMLDQAQRRWQDEVFSQESDWGRVKVDFVRADATTGLVKQFGLEPVFDTVVDSFSLCVMGNEGAAKCLDQIRKTVKPGGKVLLLENSRASNPILGAYQDATANAAASVGGKGCIYNQDVEAMIQATKGLYIQQQKSFAAGLFRSFECSVR